jgi:hypothetical protein
VGRRHKVALFYEMFTWPGGRDLVANGKDDFIRLFQRGLTPSGGPSEARRRLAVRCPRRVRRLLDSGSRALRRSAGMTERIMTTSRSSCPRRRASPPASRSAGLSITRLVDRPLDVAALRRAAYPLLASIGMPAQDRVRRLLDSGSRALRLLGRNDGRERIRNDDKNHPRGRHARAGGHSVATGLSMAGMPHNPLSGWRPPPAGCRSSWRSRPPRRRAQTR